MTVVVTIDAERLTPVALGAFTGSLFASHSPIQACSLAEARDYLGNILAPHQLGLRGRGKKLRLLHNSAGIHQLSLHFIAYQSDAEGVEVLAPKLETNILLKIPLSGSAEVSQGRGSYIIRPGMIFLAEPRKPLTASMSPDYQQLTLQVPMSVLLHAANSELHELGNEKLQFDTDAINTSPAPRLLLSTLGSICQALDSRDGMFTQPMVQRSFQSTLISLILGLPHNLAGRLGEGRSCAAPYYIRRAEDFMRAHLTDDIGIEDLIRVAGVSRRSLHAGFRRFRDTTPLSLLKSLKLEAARDEILACNGVERTVTDIATHYGFYHLSKFARDFRESFGLLPSEMLKGSTR